MVQKPLEPHKPQQCLEDLAALASYMNASKRRYWLGSYGPTSEPGVCKETLAVVLDQPFHRSKTGRAPSLQRPCNSRAPSSRPESQRGAPKTARARSKKAKNKMITTRRGRAKKRRAEEEEPDDDPTEALVRTTAALKDAHKTAREAEKKRLAQETEAAS